MTPMTMAQAELLSFIERYTSENNGVAPTFEEMKQALGVASKSGIHRLVCALEERGRIRRLRDRARAIEVIAAPPENALQAYPTVELLAEITRRSRIAREQRIAA